jgi:hypothetical protein
VNSILKLILKLILLYNLTFSIKKSIRKKEERAILEVKQAKIQNVRLIIKPASKPT